MGYVGFAEVVCVLRRLCHFVRLCRLCRGYRCVAAITAL